MSDFGHTINPTTGMPMISGTMIDVGGNAFGYSATRRASPSGSINAGGLSSAGGRRLRIALAAFAVVLVVFISTIAIVVETAIAS